LQDFTGVPLLVDLAAMRSAVGRLGRDASLIETAGARRSRNRPFGTGRFSSSTDAFRLNMEMEFKRNRARYQFLKWGMQHSRALVSCPPASAIVHQVNLEYLAKGVQQRDGIYYPDTLVGTDSHSTMINGVGVVGWGVAVSKRKRGMLGQPVYFLTPDVVGVHMAGRLKEA